jgi:hypothetical protein
MKKQTLVAACLLLSLTGSVEAQSPQSSTSDTWGSAPTARDDRFSNPKSPLYSGPDGWYNSGEVRAEVSNAAKTRYAYKSGFQTMTPLIVAAEANNLRVMNFDFGVDRPAPGVYQLAGKANAAQKKANVAFTDVSDKKIRAWASNDKSGTVTVSLVNGFLYFKCRGVILQPTGLNNTGDLKNPMVLGFEGALKPE